MGNNNLLHKMPILLQQKGKEERGTDKQVDIKWVIKLMLPIPTREVMEVSKEEEGSRLPLLPPKLHVLGLLEYVAQQRIGIK
jgi:hypothetical protein